MHPEVELVRVARLGLARQRLERGFFFVEVGRSCPVVGFLLEEAEAGAAGTVVGFVFVFVVVLKTLMMMMMRRLRE